MISELTYAQVHLINNPRMFNLATDDLAMKPYIPHKIFVANVLPDNIGIVISRSWRLLEAKNTPWRPKMA